jgi:hypothetical protein
MLHQERMMRFWFRVGVSVLVLGLMLAVAIDCLGMTAQDARFGSRS